MTFWMYEFLCTIYMDAPWRLRDVRMDPLTKMHAL